MRKIEHPLVDDKANLAALSKSRAASAKAIKAQLSNIQARYTEYHDSKGDPWRIVSDPILSTYRNHLENLYKSPPVALGFIELLRDSMAGACPVCGRDALGTLDHYLPKAKYSEFSFFSKNLVPACNRCNNSRGNLTKGGAEPQRPVHPYYDDFASRRIMSVSFEPDWRAPKLRPVPFDVVGDELTTVQWHIDNIVRPSGFDDYMINLWGALVASPDTYFQNRRDVMSMATEMLRQQHIEEASGNSKNAWRSCFYHGLSINHPALEYIANLP